MNNRILTILAHKDKFEPGTPASENNIVEAEKTLGLSFSQEYRTYLEKYGSASFFGHILTGISPFPGVNVVEVTLEQREFNPIVPHSMYVIEQLHIDGVVIWQDFSGSIYQTTPGSKPMKICDSLKEYLQI